VFPKFLRFFENFLKKPLIPVFTVLRGDFFNSPNVAYFTILENVKNIKA